MYTAVMLADHIKKKINNKKKLENIEKDFKSTILKFHIFGNPRVEKLTSITGRKPVATPGHQAATNATRRRRPTPGDCERHQAITNDVQHCYNACE